MLSSISTAEKMVPSCTTNALSHLSADNSVKVSGIISQKLYFIISELYSRTEGIPMLSHEKQCHVHTAIMAEGMHMAGQEQPPNPMNCFKAEPPNHH